jgi:hypothetical protein
VAVTSAASERRHIRFDLLSAYVLVPAMVALVSVSSIFRDPPALPVEMNDEAVHTFVEAPMVLRHLVTRGQFLKMNLFGNFGTPTLGEPILCPFAPHALTYLAFSPADAMLVNQALLAALTVAMVTLFLSRYLPLSVASLCGVLAFTDPSFYYTFPNHPHQGALLYFSCALIAIHWASEGRRFGLAVTYLAFLAFLLGVGVNGVLFGTPFLLGYAVLVARPWRRALAVAGAFAAAGTAVHAHFIEFFRLAARSARIAQSLVLYPESDSYDVLRNLLVWSPEQWSMPGTVFYSIPVVVLALMGATVVAASLRTTWGRWLGGGLRDVPVMASAIFGLGVLPLLVVLLSLKAPGALAAVPGLASVNMVRVLWFANVFLMLAVGAGLAWLLHRPLQSFRVAQAALWALVLVSLEPRWKLMGPQWNTDPGLASVAFRPRVVLDTMSPGTRLAEDSDPVPDVRPGNQEYRAAARGVFGSAGRSIILDRAFRDYWVSREWVRFGYMSQTYYFLARPPADFARLGIRWFATYGSGEELRRLGWHPRLAVDGYALFENPEAVTPVYVDAEPRVFLPGLTIDGNDLRVDLPSARPGGDVVVTFVKRPGWKAFLDGRPVPIRAGEDSFMRISAEGGRSLRLVYEPFSDRYLWGSLLLSLALAAGLAFRRRHREPSHSVG